MITEWIRGGMEIKGIGMTVAGVSIEVSDKVGKELIDNGLAKKGKSVNPMTDEEVNKKDKKEKGGNK